MVPLEFVWFIVNEWDTTLGSQFFDALRMFQPIILMSSKRFHTNSWRFNEEFLILPCCFLFSISRIFSSLFFCTFFSFFKLLLGNVTSEIMDKDLQSYSIKCEPKIFTCEIFQILQNKYSMNRIWWNFNWAEFQWINGNFSFGVPSYSVHTVVRI